MLSNSAAAATTNPMIFTGYADVSYNYLVRNNHFVNGYYNRLNDNAENGVSLQQAAATLGYIPDQGWGGLVNAVIGRDAILLAPFGFNPRVFNLQNIGLFIPQAFLQYQYKRTTFIIGEMQSLAGYEQIDYTLNTIFSNSLLYSFAEPGVHLGVRADHMVNDQLSVSLGANNGWDTIQGPSRLNTFEFGTAYRLPERLTLNLILYLGETYLADQLSSGPRSERQYINFYATYFFNSKLSASVNADYGVQHKATLPNGVIAQATWQGIAGYVDYKIKEKWIASVRAEIFNDSDGFRTNVRQQLHEITLSLAYLPIKNWQIRGGTRHDFSNVNSFISKNGRSTNPNQQSYAVDVLYQF
jgi:hypothetical protein